jgi:single-strand DNA-binding protein
MNKIIVIGNVGRDPELRYSPSGQLQANSSKGQQVYIEGRLKSRTYQTRDGQTRFSNDVTVTEVQFLSRPDNREPVPAGMDEDDDLLSF